VSRRANIFAFCLITVFAWADEFYISSLLSSSEQEIAKGLLDLLAKDYTSAAHRRQLMSGNRVTRGTLQIEDSPGNFTIQKNEDHVIVRIYDATGRAVTEKFNFTPTAPSTP